MDVDRDKHFSVSDLQALEEEDNRVSGQAVRKNTSFWNRFLLLQRCALRWPGLKRIAKTKEKTSMLSKKNTKIFS